MVCNDDALESGQSESVCGLGSAEEVEVEIAQVKFSQSLGYSLNVRPVQ